MSSLPWFFWFGVAIAAVFVTKIIVVTVLCRFTDVPVNRDVQLLIVYALMLFAFMIGNAVSEHHSLFWAIVEGLGVWIFGYGFADAIRAPEQQATDKSQVTNF